MWLLDQWAERHIAEAQAKGEFDNLAGSGEPLILDDDSHVPPELRAGYRLLKNAGCLPPELEQRREAIQLLDILNDKKPMGRGILVLIGTAIPAVVKGLPNLLKNI